MNLTVACAGTGSAAQLGALNDLRQRVDSLGIADAVRPGENSRKIPIWVEIEVMQLQAKGRVEGMSSEVRARIDTLLELHERNPGMGLGGDLSKLTRMLSEGALDRNALGSMAESEAVRIVRAAATGDDGVVAVEDPMCVPMVRPTENLISRYDTEREKKGVVRSFRLRSIGASANGLAMVGCVNGVAPTIDSLGAAAAWADTVDARLRTDRKMEDCEENLGELAKAVERYKKPYSADQEAMNTAFIVMRVFSQAVVPGCATIE